MARRTLINIEGKIIKETIKMGAKVGVEKVSTLQLAKKCDITEPTIFVHFKTKKNLLFQAKLVIDKEMDARISKADMSSPEKVIESVKKIWQECFEYLIEHKDEAKYYNRYRHSALYVPTTHFSEDGNRGKAFERITALNPTLAKYKDVGYQTFWVHVIESTINFAERIADGKLAYDEEMRELIFHLIFGSVFKDI